MVRRSRQNQAVREFILRRVSDHPHDIGPLTAREFDVSRTAVSRYMQRLIDEGMLTASGQTKARVYKLKPLKSNTFQLPIDQATSEEMIWRFRVGPDFAGIRENVVGICQYGFTEMLNNAIDHSEGREVTISYEIDYARITMRVADNGIGIFERLQRDFGFPDPRGALLELLKGKLTSNELAHAGEGIFFTSRMFDKFEISSGRLSYVKRRNDEGEGSTEVRDLEEGVVGTRVVMTIATDADWTRQDVFDRFIAAGTRRTQVPVRLGQYPGEALVSRSQAKRVVARFEQFSEVILDFEGVDEIGQGFADEIFRVFKNAHPAINLVAVRANDKVQRMIDFVRGPPKRTS
jgi:anti-sigma regulatory factor (Ser/Thr protein kinase)